MKRLIGANIGIVIATVITLGAPAAKAEPLSGGFSVKHQALIFGVAGSLTWKLEEADGANSVEVT